MAHLKGRKLGGDAAYYDPVPPNSAEYGKVSFWDGRYLADLSSRSQVIHA